MPSGQHGAVDWGIVVSRFSGEISHHGDSEGKDGTVDEPSQEHAETSISTKEPVANLCREVVMDSGNPETGKTLLEPAVGGDLFQRKGESDVAYLSKTD